MRTSRWLLIPIVVLAVAHWLVLALELPVLTSLPLWFWRLQTKTLTPVALIIALAALAGLATFIALRGALRPVLAVLGLIVTGYLLQQGLGLLEGHGLDGIRDRMVHSAHAQFAVTAAREPNPLSLVRNYEALSSKGVLGAVALTKPPGQELLYLATERLATLTVTNTTADERLDRTRTLAAFLWPLVSMLTLIPLFLLANVLRGPTVGLAACLLYTLVPSAQLMTLHTDQTFFPLLFTTALHLAVLAMMRGSVALGLAAGVSAYVNCFFSFGLVALGPLVAVVTVGSLIESAGDARRRRLLALLAFLVGVVATGVFGRVVASYDLVAAYGRATTLHASWKGEEWSAWNLLYFGFLDGLEFALWTGIPIAAFALLRAGRSVSELRRRSLSTAGWVVLGTAVTFGLLAFFGHTRAESGRLWLFLVPATCLLAADELQTRFEARASVVIALTAAAQWITVLLTKAHQDFW